MTNKMSDRRANRLAAVQFLYMWEMNDSDSLDKSLSHFFQVLERDRLFYEFAEDLVCGALENQEAIDEVIKEHSQNWRFSRIAKVDLAILRLAIYELLKRKDIPPIVSITEAIDLAKILSSADSKRFINGILDKVKTTLDRPLRSAE